jgi:hypothetical protein
MIEDVAFCVWAVRALFEFGAVNYGYRLNGFLNFDRHESSLKSEV